MERDKTEKIVKNILSIEEELKLRATPNALDLYNTGEKIHLKQLEFHKMKKRNRWAFGGNRTGKTECGAVECVYMARGIHPYRDNRANTKGWVVSPTYEVQREVSQSKILHYLKPEWIENIVMQEGSKSSPEYGVIDTIYIKNIFGGVSQIGFKTHEQGRQKMQGASLDYVWFDEEPPEDIYYECKMRVLDKKGDIFGTMTPLMGLTFVYEEIYLNQKSDKEVAYVSMEWADNPFLDKEEIEEFSKSISDDMLDSRRYGLFRINEGLVYKEFKENVHIIDPIRLPQEWQSGISIDPGLNNPLSCHFYYVDYDGKIYVAEEHYEKGKDINYHTNAIKKIAERLDWKKNHNDTIEALIDSASNQKTLASSKSVAELFYENGIAVNSKVNKDLFSGIARVKQLFSAMPPQIFIFRNCVNLIREIKSYWWGEGDRPIKRDDHALDELRYFVMSSPEVPKLEISFNKAALYKTKLLKSHNRRCKNDTKTER